MYLTSDLFGSTFHGFEKSNCFIDYFIRNEHLEADLFSTLEAIGYRIPEKKKQDLTLSPKTNISSRSGTVGDYYDSDLIRMVADREKLLIDKFDYELPELATAQ